MIEISCVTFDALLVGSDDLIKEYIEETANANIGKPEAQFDRYRQLESLGQLRCIAVRDDDVLVGVAILLIAQSQHYQAPLVGVDSFFLRKPWRRGTTGLKLLRKAKEVAKAEGAMGLTLMAPPGTTYDKLCSRLGMAHTHNCYWSSFDD